MQQEPNTGLSVKFGDELMQGGFTVVPNYLLKLYAELGISPTELVFIEQIWLYWYERQQDMFPALSTIAERMRLSRRQVQAYVSSLKEKKYHDKETGYVSKPYLQVKERYAAAGGGQLSNQYDFSGLLEAVAYLVKKKGLIDEPASEAALTPPQINTSMVPQKFSSMAPQKKTSTEEDEDKKNNFKKTKILRRADALTTKREGAAYSHIDRGTIRKPKASEPTQELKFSYIGKPFTQEDMNKREKEGKNASGITPLANILSERWLQLQQQQQAKAYTIPTATRTTSRSTKNAPMFIKAIIEQFSDLLGDEPESEPQDINRTAKLYRRSKLEEDDFRNMLFEVYRQVQDIPDERINRKRADGRPNKMLLFFTMLEDRLGLKH